MCLRIDLFINADVERIEEKGKTAKKRKHIMHIQNTGHAATTTAAAAVVVVVIIVQCLLSRLEHLDVYNMHASKQYWPGTYMNAS